MLTLTTSAATMIRTVVDHSGTPEGSGIRIANDPAAGSLTMSVAAVPAEDDQVLEADGARLFLDTQAATLLDDKTLDAAPDSDGGVQFGIVEQ
jgi:iron-sulfur cluster assembly protein